MQWTTTGDRITLPYVAPEDDLQSTPATIKALAEAVVAELELATPVGAISPYMGDVAPDGWLICDGSEYDPADLPELYAVNSAFHAADAPGEFRVPDLRGRSLLGDGTSLPQTSSDPAHAYARLGERGGDWRLSSHRHDTLQPNVYDPGGATSWGLIASGGGHGNLNAFAQISVGWPVDIAAAGNNYGTSPLDPYTGVNFIVYAGRPTVGISPLSELPHVTTRMMIEQRLAQAGIGEEEVKMLKELKEQLESLKTTEAK